MFCLTLTQPWATLVVLGIKRLETRSWSTPYRGPLAIHAARRFPAEARALCLQEPFCRILSEAGYPDWHGLPRGQLLGTVELADCRRAETVTDLSALDRALGDFRAGRWVWVLQGAMLLPAPIPFRGRLGLFSIPDGLVQGGLSAS